MENDRDLVENVVRLWKTWIFSALLWLLLINPANASIHTYPEPNGVLYRSLSTLSDQSNHAWQAVFYKRFQLGQPDSLRLRIIGFPGVVEIDHDRSLEIQSGQTLLGAIDVTPSDFSLAHVGEYDLKPILHQLDSSAKLALVVPVQSNSVRLTVPDTIALEWWRVASWQPQTP